MTINAVGNYNRFMAPAFLEMDKMPVHTFFLTLFAGSGGETIIELDSSVIDIDIQRGNKKKSVYIPRGSDAVNLGTDKSKGLLERYTSDSKIFPLMEEETPVTSAMITKRMPGEPVYQPMSRAMKQAALAMKAHREHLRRLIRQMEFSACEAIRTGEQTIQGGLKYDFYRLPSHNQTAAVVWSTAATATPISDLSSAATKIFQDGNRRATDVIMGDGSWTNFLETAQVKELANNRRIVHFVSDMQANSPAGYDDWVNAGAMYQGQVKAGNYVLNIWTYPAIFEDNGGTNTQYMPDAQVVVLAKGARYDRYFGPADRLEIANNDFYRDTFGINVEGGIPENVMNSGIFDPRMFHFDAYGANNNKALNIRTQSAPIFPTTEVDTIVKIETE